MKKINITDGLYIGADGCRGGWIVCALDRGELRIERHPSMDGIVSRYPVFDAFLIDMATGLRTSAEQTRADDIARRRLGARASTVFLIPCRQAVYARTEEEQKAANIEVLGKSLSKQTVNIIPKLRELDEFLQSRPEYKNRILESHPELDFAGLNGAVVMSRKKEEEGLTERREILERYLPVRLPADLKDMARELGCASDDILDAACLAVTAALYARERYESLPEVPDTDGTGIVMRLIMPSADL